MLTGSDFETLGEENRKAYPVFNITPSGKSCVGLCEDVGLQFRDELFTTNGDSMQPCRQ